MQEIIFQLENNSDSIQYYCVIDFNKLYVVPSKSFEKRVFWNEFSDYEFKSGKILRVKNYKDNVLSRLLGFSEKSQKFFDTESDIGITSLEYFSTGCVRVSIQKVYQEGMIYTCDFVACSTDTLNLFNFYNIIKHEALIWGSSPYHLRGRCGLNYLMKDISFNFFISADYALRARNYMYIEDKEVYDKYVEYLRVSCTLHNEKLYTLLE